MITQLHLKSFTTFSGIAIDFSPGINIVIGENGTEKTLLLKSNMTQDRAHRRDRAET